MQWWKSRTILKTEFQHRTKAPTDLMALRVQLEAVIANPEWYTEYDPKLLQLCRRASVALESPSEAF